MPKRLMSLLLLAAAVFVLTCTPASFAQSDGTAEAANAAADAAQSAADAAESAADAAGDAAETADDSSAALPDDLTDTSAWMEWFETNGMPIAISVAKALAILIIAWIIAGMVAGFIRKQGDKRAKLDVTLARFFANIAKWAILALALISILGVFGIQTASFAALIAAAGLAVGLALQGSLSNFASGVMILIFRPFKIGQFIEAGGVSGTVDEIQLFTTTLDTPDNRRIIVPNSAIFDGNITNFGHHAIRRVDVEVGVDYSADIDATRKVLEGVVNSIEQKTDEKPSAVVLTGLGASSVDWVLRIWVPSGDFWAVKEEATRRTKIELDKAGIGIPFPQMDVHLNKLN